jgi:hypothetical protein
MGDGTGLRMQVAIAINATTNGEALVANKRFHLRFYGA